MSRRRIEPNDNDEGVITPEFAALSPTVQTALTADMLERTRLGKDYKALDLNALMNLLVGSLKRFHQNDIRGIENGLINQATVLNLLFHRFIRSACDGHMDEQHVIEAGIAFRAQSQCRATLATLAAIKSPASIAFVNQANIAHGPQQVNNGPMPRGRKRAQKGKNRPSKQSGRRVELLPNPRASSPKGATDSEVETLGTSDRPEVGGGKG